MISFDHFIPNDQSPIYQQIILYIKQGIAAGIIQSPIYQQIILYIKQGIAAGIIHNGDEMPSRRTLSALLGVNPNTVQKSYKLLEEEGIISSTPGAKSCVTVDEGKTSSIRAGLIATQAQAIITAMKQTGVSKEEALRMVAALWDEM